MPRRVKTVGQCATVAPCSANRRRIGARIVPVRPGVVIEEDPVPDDAPRPESAEAVQPLDGRHAVAPRDLVKLR